MTVFFGLPNQLYFSRSPSTEEEIADRKLQYQAGKVQEKYADRAAKSVMEDKGLMGAAARYTSLIGAQWSGLSPAVTRVITQRFLALAVKASPAGSIIDKAVSNYFRERRLRDAMAGEWIRPFRRYHLLTSAQHIVANNIRANARDIANTITIEYPGTTEKEEKEFEKLTGQALSWTLKLDSALPPEEIRTQVCQFLNVTNTEQAKRYGLGMLIRNLKEVYKGEVIVIGNPSIKPYDVCYLFDAYTDMIGAFEVEEVQHVFDQQHGFRTEIKPDMLLQAQEHSLMSSAHALSIVAEGLVSKLAVAGTASWGNSPLAKAMGSAAGAIGGFMAGKIINFTPAGQPVVMSPLMHHGRIFTGGIPTRKIPSSIWDTFTDKYSAGIDKGFNNWWEDWKDRWIGGIQGRIQTSMGLHQVGNFWNSGGDSPE
jgi:hypothetical protein